MAMSEKNDRQAPDRVFIAWPNDNGCGLAFTVPSKAGQTRTEFVRADLAAPSAPAEVEGLVDALRSYQQADMDGVIVKVSRQACEEAATALTAQQARIAELEGEFDGLITDLLKSGVAHAKTAAERDSLLAAIGEWARPTGANGMTTPSEHHPLMVARAKIKGHV